MAMHTARTARTEHTAFTASTAFTARTARTAHTAHTARTACDPLAFQTWKCWSVRPNLRKEMCLSLSMFYMNYNHTASSDPTLPPSKGPAYVACFGRPAGGGGSGALLGYL